MDDVGDLFIICSNITGKNSGSRQGKAVTNFFGDSLDTWAASGQSVFGAAFGTAFRRKHFETAMVTNQFTCNTMFGKPSGTMRTLNTMPAIATNKQRSVAATVKKEHRLLSALKIMVNFIHQSRRQKRNTPRTFLWFIFFQVDNFNFR